MNDINAIIAGADVSSLVSITRSFLAAVQEKVSSDWGSMSPETKKQMYDLADDAKSIASSVSDQCRADLVAGTAIEGLYLARVSRTTGMDVVAAAPVLKKEFGLTDNGLLGLCSLSVTKLRDFAFGKRSLDIPGLTEKANTAYVNKLIEPYVTKSEQVTVKAGTAKKK